MGILYSAQACAHARGGSTGVLCAARVLHHIEDFPCLGNPVLAAVPITPAPAGTTAASSASTSASPKWANERPRRTKPGGGRPRPTAKPTGRSPKRSGSRNEDAALSV